MTVKDQTETIVLGAEPVRETGTTVRSFQGLLTTDTFHPEGVEISKENPTPAEGYASVEESAEMGVVEHRGTPVLTEDGRYRLELPAVEETVLLPDQRIRVTVPKAWPWCVQGHMEMQFPNGKWFIGSGTMVNRHHVLTAGHCVYSKADGGWATTVRFCPAQDGASTPFGCFTAVRLVSVTAWTNNTDSDWDMGMLILGSEAGNQTGWFGVVTFPSDGSLQNARVNVTGYPGDKGGRQMWTMADIVTRLTPERFFYQIDTAGGQSGSGVWGVFPGQQGEKVAGIHTTGSSSENGATRISRAKFDRIVQWFHDY
jgi:glutamyl endopeptidase